MVVMRMIMGACDSAVGPMDVIMMMRVRRERTRGGLAEQIDERPVTTDVGGFTRTADMPVEAVHAICGRHHDIEVVRDQKHAAAGARALARNDLIDLDGAGRIDVLCGLVEHKQRGIEQQRAREHHTLQFTTGKPKRRRVEKLSYAEFIEHGVQAGFGRRGRQRQDATDGKRQCLIEMISLRQIAHRKPWGTPNLAAIELFQAENRADQRRFARPIRPDDGHDLAARNGQIDVIKHLPVVAFQHGP